MGAEKIVLDVQLGLTIQETLAAAVVPGADSADRRTVTHGKWTVNETFGPNSTPIPTRCLVLEITLDGTGFYEINLASAATTGSGSGGEDLTGKRVMAFEASTPDDNAGVIAICDQAGSNKYPLLGAGNELDLPADSMLPLLVRSSELPLIAAGARTIRFSGTEGDVVRVKLAFEDGS